MTGGRLLARCFSSKELPGANVNGSGLALSPQLRHHARNEGAFFASISARHRQTVTPPPPHDRSEAVPDWLIAFALGIGEKTSTFETLQKEFKIRNPGVKIISEIIHDADLADDKFGRKERHAFIYGDAVTTYSQANFNEVGHSSESEHNAIRIAEAVLAIA